MIGGPFTPGNAGYPGLTQQSYWLPFSSGTLQSAPTGAFGAGGLQGDGDLRSAALAKLRESLSGPYSEQAQSRLIARQADMTAAAEGQQQAKLAEDAANRGVSANDPGLQAEQRRITAGRQQANQGIAGDVGNAATMANYQGGMQAANALLGHTRDPWSSGVAFSGGGEQREQGTQAPGFIGFANRQQQEQQTPAARQPARQSRQATPAFSGALSPNFKRSLTGPVYRRNKSGKII